MLPPIILKAPLAKASKPRRRTLEPHEMRATQKGLSNLIAALDASGTRKKKSAQSPMTMTPAKEASSDDSDAGQISSSQGSRRTTSKGCT